MASKRKKRLTPNQKAYNEEYRRIVEDVLQGNEELAKEILPERQQRISKKRIQLLKDFQSPLLQVEDGITLNALTGEIVPTEVYQTDEYHPLPSSTNTSIQSDIILNKVFSIIDKYWGAVYTKDSNNNISTAEYLHIHINYLIDQYSREEIARALEDVGEEAIELSHSTIFASTQDQLERRTDAFVSLIMQKLSIVLSQQEYVEMSEAVENYEGVTI